MEKYLGHSTTMPQRTNRSAKLKENKNVKEQHQMEAESDSQHSQVDLQIFGPLFDQKLASIKESISEVLRQVTNTHND
ncbi:hypothetical protein XELAEV_18001706mg [Xenopus laevis]|nr:hypothetical protein XELAEV_18001706mg [Xenopus laevis]